MTTLINSIIPRILTLLTLTGALLLFAPTSRAQNNTAYGAGALKSGSAKGLDDSAFGVGALNKTVMGAYNTAAGYFALNADTTGTGNTAAGANALLSNTTGSFNTAIGLNALLFNSSGLSNTAIGRGALYSNTSGGQNAGIGGLALHFNTTGTANTANGAQALYNCRTDSGETATGFQALYSDAVGFKGGPNENVADGYQALYSSTDGFANVASGYQALFNSTEGDSNTAIGFQALFSITTGFDNIALGNGAGSSLTTGSNDIDIGHPGVTGESNTIRIGNGTTQTDIYLTGVIHGNGSAITSISANSLTGTASELSLPATTSSTTGVLNIGGVPFLSAPGSSVYDGNQFFGVNAGNFSLIGNAYHDIGIGENALNGLTDGNNNVAIGVYTLPSDTSGAYNTAIGNLTLYLNTNGSQNTASGFYTLAANTSGSNNTATGVNALQSNTSGSYNIAIGLASGLNLSTGGYNIDIGDYNGRIADDISGESNTIRIGEVSTQTATYIAGIYGAASTSSSATLVYIDETGLLVTSSTAPVNFPPGSIPGVDLAPGALAAPVSVSGGSQAAVANTTYVATSGSLTVLTAPASANVGDVVNISGAGAGGWQFGIFGFTPQAGTDSENWLSAASSADGTHLIAGVAGGSIVSSTDSGATWAATSAPSTGYWSAAASSADGSHLAAVNGNGGSIYTSTDFGATWGQSGAPVDFGYISIASSTDGNFLAAVSNNGAVYTSTNAGLTWTPTSAPSEGWYGVACSADGSHLAAAPFGAAIYTSTDSGATWNASTSGTENWFGIASSSDGSHLVAVASGGGIYTSTDSGATWNLTSAPTGNYQSLVSSADGSHLAAAIYGSYIYTSADGGATWTAQTAAPTVTWRAMASSATGNLLLAAPAGGDLETLTSYSPFGAGAQGGSAQYQYEGNGVWQALQQNGTWMTSGSNLYYNTGNVGIGTSTPAYPLAMASGAYCSTAGVWTNVSDRNVKENFLPIAPGDVLAKVAAMPITQWKYKVEASGIKHIGPVAQDFHAAFGLGDSDRAIGSVDESGVALAAIQGLNQKLEAENAALKKEIAAQAARDQALEDRLSRLEKAAVTLRQAPPPGSQPADIGR